MAGCRPVATAAAAVVRRLAARRSDRLQMTAPAATAAGMHLKPEKRSDDTLTLARLSAGGQVEGLTLVLDIHGMDQTVGQTLGHTEQRDAGRSLCFCLQ